MTGTFWERRSFWLVIIDAGIWITWSTLVGYVAHRLPIDRLDRDGWLLRLRSTPDRVARWYAHRLRIKRWKPHLPEAGDLFEGGFNKSHLVQRDRPYLERFLIETRRAELTHWVIMAIAPLFFLWNPFWVAVMMAGYGVIANVPCLLVQRYNRARLMRTLAPGPISF
jgi:glycosyl-4,4'-diaponeurosporenoate acyltransferase